MPTDYDGRHQEVDVILKKEETFARYRRIKNFGKHELSLDDQIFLENFEVAMRHLWTMPCTEIVVKLTQEDMEG